MLSIFKPFAVLATALAVGGSPSGALGDAQQWNAEWPRTDFARHSVPLTEIKSGAEGRPSGWASRLTDREPVISLSIGRDHRAYPLRILISHEIVSDSVGGLPVTVTYCPLCNAAMAFDRRLEGKLLDFGTTGKLRDSDLVMYDRQTESWWQQFTGEAIVGVMTGLQLNSVPARLESFQRFRERFPNGQVLVPTDLDARDYGSNPYSGYDSAHPRPFLYDGSLPDGIEAMERVIAVEVLPGQHEAWSLDLLRRHGTIRRGDLVLTWKEGQSSPLDKRAIAEGREVGNVVVQRERDGRLVDVAYDVPFAFAFHAFRPKSPIHTALPK